MIHLYQYYQSDNYLVNLNILIYISYIFYNKYHYFPYNIIYIKKLYYKLLNSSYNKIITNVCTRLKLGKLI